MSTKALPRSRPEPQRPTTQAARRAPYPAAATGARGAAGYNTRQGPPHYSVEHLHVNGKVQEVITIEDTPEPSGAGHSNAGGSIASRSGARYDGYGGAAAAEPAAKRRKSDGAHVSDQPYASSSSSSSRAKQAPPAYHAESRHGASGSTSKNKRKHGQDAYEDYADRGQRPAPKARPAEAPATCDKEGHFIVKPGAVIGHETRFVVNKLLGQGTFGKVVSATNEANRREVAVKIIRNVPKYREASRVETRVLQSLRNADRENKFKCITLIEEFDYQGHVCLVSPLLGPSVFDFLKENQYNPFPYSHVQSFARQLLTSVGFVHRNRFVHTDLKPENILLEDTASDSVTDRDTKKTRKILKNTSIHLIDFGSATADKDYHATVVSTRHYRAPEIILGMGWDHHCDLWSIGCILVEFVTGEALFQTHENLEHLAMMERVFGKMPDDYIKRAVELARDTERAAWFKADRDSRKPVLNFPQAPVAGQPSTTQKQSVKFVKSMKPLAKIIKQNEIWQGRFCSLLEGLLQWRAGDRISIDAALQHPFFEITINDEGRNSYRPQCPDLPPYVKEVVAARGR